MRKLVTVSRFHRSVVFFLGFTLACLGVLFGSNRFSTFQSAAPGEQGKIAVPLKAKQLDFLNGVVPIALICQETVMVYPETLDKIPCTIKNNSGRVITALVLGTSVNLDVNGILSTQSNYVTIDTFIHTDFHTQPGERKGIKPNAEPQFPLASETYSGIITQVQVYVDYAEFDDKQSVGPNKAGADILRGIRDGADKYKRWLVKEFELNGRSVVALQRLIEDDQPISAEVGIGSSSQEQGAVIYRKWLRRIRSTKGVEELKKHFIYRSASTN